MGANAGVWWCVSEQAARILEALESHANATEVDALFPAPLSPQRASDHELVQAHAELQIEIRAQVPPSH